MPLRNGRGDVMEPKSNQQTVQSLTRLFLLCLSVMKKKQPVTACKP